MADAQLPGSLVLFPDWKKNATAYERLMELAIVAKLYPDRFRKMIVIWSGAGVNGEPGEHFRHITAGTSTIEAVGLTEIGKSRLIAKNTEW